VPDAEAVLDGSQGLGALSVLVRKTEPLAEIAKDAKEEYAWYIRPAWISNLNMLGVLYVLGERMPLAEAQRMPSKE